MIATERERDVHLLFSSLLPVRQGDDRCPATDTVSSASFSSLVSIFAPPPPPRPPPPPPQPLSPYPTAYGGPACERVCRVPHPRTQANIDVSNWPNIAPLMASVCLACAPCGQFILGRRAERRGARGCTWLFVAGRATQRPPFKPASISVHNGAVTTLQDGALGASPPNTPSCQGFRCLVTPSLPLGPALCPPSTLGTPSVSCRVFLPCPLLPCPALPCPAPSQIRIRSMDFALIARGTRPSP